MNRVVYDSVDSAPTKTEGDAEETKGGTAGADGEPVEEGKEEKKTAAAAAAEKEKATAAATEAENATGESGDYDNDSILTPYY